MVSYTQINMANLIAPVIATVSLGGTAFVLGATAPIIASAAAVGLVVGTLDEMLVAYDIAEHHYLTGMTAGMALSVVPGTQLQRLANGYIANLAYKAQNLVMELAEPNRDVVNDESVCAPVERNPEYVAAEQFYMKVASAEYFVTGYNLVKFTAATIGSAVGACASSLVSLVGDNANNDEHQDITVIDHAL